MQAGTCVAQLWVLDERIFHASVSDHLERYLLKNGKEIRSGVSS
jgi:hypothetical protein